jgi:hypothetical protein
MKKNKNKTPTNQIPVGYPAVACGSGIEDTTKKQETKMTTPNQQSGY